jgi:hypothetical protein
LEESIELGVTSVEGCGFTHKQIVQMWGSPDNIKSIHDFSKKLKNLDLTFEEISIFSNGGHLGYRTVLTDTILKGDHLSIISAKFG